VRRTGLFLTMLAVCVGASGFAAAAGYFDDWATAKLPDPPALKPVIVDAKTTALLVLDFAPNCGQNPRCAPALPKIHTLQASARTHGMPVVYTHTRQNANGGLPPEIAAQPGEPNLDARANKFYESDMDSFLKSKGVKTVIICGIAGENAVLFTAVGAAERGYSVIVPVDCMPTGSVFGEVETLDRISKGAVVGPASTITAADMISF
jgi:nicotinamidase-related amidase